ncbi:hypothetical protein [Pseudomonas sp. RL_105y_Pfl2_101]|uniref:hypothetical protein n=1 Tax=Pseudomonas sp. RL_105y_Pfl2_101 TaxID=3088708 RepID=UPI0030DA8F38
MDTADNNPLVYDELEIPDGGPAHPPAPAGSVGINIAAARVIFPHDGLRLLLPPWDNMGQGDSFRIKLNNIPVLPGSIDEETEVGQRVERYIPVGGLVDGDFNLNYDVRLLGEPDFTSSAVTKIHVKIDEAPPGGQDQDGDTPGHSELKLTIPVEFLPPGAVDKDAAAAGVPVTIEPYPIMAEGDRIKLSWGGEFIWKTVDAQHLPPQSAPLVITVDEDTIHRAGDTDSNGLAVVFEVYDRVDNKSEDWSAEVRVIVDTGNSRLMAPLIKEVNNLVLDMDQLGEADLTYQVIAMDANFKVGDDVEIHLTGTTAEGEKIEEVTYAPERILNTPSILEFKRPSAEVRQLAGGPHAAFFYRLIKADGSADLFSKIFSPRIVGRANPLAAPIPLDEIAGTLDPQLPSTTIEIPLDPAMEEGNAIELIWNGTRANGTSYKPDLPPHPITANEAGGSVPIEIVVAGHLTDIEGGTLDLYYKLLRDVVSREVLEEESLHADLLSIGEPQAELPVPVVEGESGGVLDPADKPDGTRLIVLQYSGQTAGDRVHILWWGSNTGQYRDSIPVTGSTENQNIPFTISAALIEGNRDGTVRAMYWVKRVGGGTSASEILTISIGAAMNLTAPSVKQASGAAPNQQLNPVAAKDALTVVIPNYGIQPGDQVSVTWAGTAGAGSQTTPPEDLSPSREVDLLTDVIPYNLGRSVTVTYIVTRNGDDSPASDPLNLTVQALDQDDLLVAKPRILQAANNGEGPELDVAALTSNATVRIDSWPLIAQGQYVWLSVKGKNKDDTDYDLPLWSSTLGSRVSAGWVSSGFATNTVPLNDLHGLRDGSALTVEFKATLNQSTDEGQAITFPLRTYTVRAIEWIKPVISSVKGQPSNAEIPNGGNTVETSVILSGTATAGMSVEIFEGTVSKGTFVATGGTWTTTTAIAVAAGARSFTAKAKYGAQPESDARTFTVVEAQKPVISSVKGQPSNIEIPNGGNTVETSVILRGTATAGMSVEIFEGAASKGTFVATGGTWTTTAIAVAAGGRSFTAKAKYGAEPVSDARTFTVVEAQKPVISSVKGQPSNTEIPNGGNTVETSVILRGTATAGMSVEIFEGAASKGTFVATGGTWTTTAIAVAAGGRSFTAKAKYGAEPVSDAHTFTVVAPLVIDPSLMNLNGRAYVTPWPRRAEAAGNTGNRVASGGTPPYTYSSSNPGIVSVNASTGFVRGEWNGSATITARDQAGRTVTYPVSVSNVLRVVIQQTVDKPDNISRWIFSNGYTSYTNGGPAGQIANQFSAPAEWYFDGDIVGLQARSVYPATGATQMTLGLPLRKGIAISDR